MEKMYITWGYEWYPTRSFLGADTQDVPPWHYRDNISINQEHKVGAPWDRQCRSLDLNLENAKLLRDQLGMWIERVEGRLCEQARWKLEGLCDQCGAPPPLVNHPEFHREKFDPDEEVGSINLCERCHGEWMKTLADAEQARKARETA